MSPPAPKIKLFNAIIFFYQEALGTQLKNVQALRARRPAGIRHAPTPSETRLLLKTIQSDAAFATSLAVRLLYGCGNAPSPDAR